MRVENPEDYVYPNVIFGSTHDMDADSRNPSPLIWVPDRKSGGYMRREVTKQRRPIGFAV